MRKLTRRQTLASMLAAGAGIAAPATRAAPAAGSAARVSFLLVNDVYRIEENKDGRGGMARSAPGRSPNTATLFACMPEIHCRQACCRASTKVRI
jgi:hypothetical protein